MSNSKYPQKVKVALIQTCPKPLDPEHNYNEAVKHLRAAAAQGAQLAVLPEYHLSGWEPDNPKFAEIAANIDKYRSGYRELAAELDMHIIPGTIVQTPSADLGLLPTPSSITKDSTTEEPESLTTTTTNGMADDSKPTLLNIAHFFSNKGEDLGHYIKTNVWIPERPHLTSSVAHLKDLHHAGIAHEEPRPAPNPHQVFDTPLGKIGILVCWDLAFPEAFRQLILQGARLIVIPTYWSAFDLIPEGRALNPDAEKLFLQSTLVARAFENTCAVVFVNAGGPAEDGFLGLSNAYMPITGAAKEGFHGPEEGFRVVEVDMSVVDLAESNYRVREDLAGDEWHYGYS